MRKLTPLNVHPADLCLLPDGKVLLAVGNRVPPYGVVGMVSDAKGQFFWDQRFVLVKDAVNGDCGYPSSIVMTDGSIMTVYYATKATEQPAWGVHCGAVYYKEPAAAPAAPEPAAK
jgi:hypothetical protein